MEKEEKKLVKINNSISVKITQFIIIVLSITILLSSINEITARDSLLKDFEKKEEEILKALFLNSSKNEFKDTPAKDYLILKAEYEMIEALKRELILLINHGKHGSFILDKDEIVELYSLGSYAQDNFYKKKFDSKEKLNKNDSEKKDNTFADSSFSKYFEFIVFSKPSELSSEILLAFVYIFSALFGAVILTIRTDDYKFGSKIVLIGITTGVVMYFSIKGSPSIILNNLSLEGQTINVYTSALFGVLAGLFSEKVYSILNLLASKLHNNVEENINKDDKIEKNS